MNLNYPHPLLFLVKSANFPASTEPMRNYDSTGLLRNVPELRDFPGGSRENTALSLNKALQREALTSAPRSLDRLRQLNLIDSFTNRIAEGGSLDNHVLSNALRNIPAVARENTLERNQGNRINQFRNTVRMLFGEDPTRPADFRGLNQYDILRKHLSPQEALKLLPFEDSENVRQKIQEGWITADAGGVHPGLSKTANWHPLMPFVKLSNTTPNYAPLLGALGGGVLGAGVAGKGFFRRLLGGLGGALAGGLGASFLTRNRDGSDGEGASIFSAMDDYLGRGGASQPATPAPQALPEVPATPQLPDDVLEQAYQAALHNRLDSFISNLAGNYPGADLSNLRGEVRQIIESPRGTRDFEAQRKRIAAARRSVPVHSKVINFADRVIPNFLMPNPSGKPSKEFKHQIAGANARRDFNDNELTPAEYADTRRSIESQNPFRPLARDSRFLPRPRIPVEYQTWE